MKTIILNTILILTMCIVLAGIAVAVAGLYALLITGSPMIAYFTMISGFGISFCAGKLADRICMVI